MSASVFFFSDSCGARRAAGEAGGAAAAAAAGAASAALGRSGPRPGDAAARDRVDGRSVGPTWTWWAGRGATAALAFSRSRRRAAAASCSGGCPSGCGGQFLGSGRLFCLGLLNVLQARALTAVAGLREAQGARVEACAADEAAALSGVSDCERLAANWSGSVDRVRCAVGAGGGWSAAAACD